MNGEIMIDPTQEQLMELLRRGIERNIVVYDADVSTKPFDVTRRLLFLMRTVGKINGTPLDTLYVPDDAYPEVDWFSHNPQSPIVIYGYQIVVTPHLNQEGIIINEYNKTGCKLPSGNHRIVIGIDRDDKPLLGAIK